MKNTHGFSLVEVLVAVSLLAIVGLGATSMISDMLKANDNSGLGSSALNLRNEFTLLLKDQRAWAQTIADTTLNPDTQSQFACLRSATDCASIVASSPYPFVPKTINNQLFRNSYNPIATASAGFNKGGQYCTVYSTTTPTDSCSMRYTFTWTPLCPPSGVCMAPQIRIALVFAHSGTSKVAKLNPDKYGDDNIIIGNLNSLYTEAACAMMSGTCDSTTQHCAEPNLASGTIVNSICSSSSYSCTTATVPTSTCGTSSGGSTPTCGTFTGTCSCTISGTTTTTTCNANAPPCACPAKCPTLVSVVYNPTTPVSPAAYAVNSSCSCP